MRMILVPFLALALFAASVHGQSPTVGEPAPSFSLQDQNGDWHTLSDYEGRWLALYFYPKDDTPGCTAQACNFRDNFYLFQRVGAAVVGVSLDDVASKEAFAEKYELPFTILADPTGEAAQAYGVLRDIGVMKMARRQTFLIDPEGRIARHYERVDPDTHTQDVVADLEALQAERSAS